MLSLEHPYYLLGLFFLLILIFFFRSVLKWKKKTKQALGDVQLIDALTAGYSSKKYFLKFFLAAVAFGLGVFALANLRKEASGKSSFKQGIDLVIALDVSNSMLSDDVKPSRLDKAKQYLQILTEKIGNNRIGLVLFAGEAFLQMPVTSDIAAAKLFISNANTDIINVQGTVLSDALQVCSNALNTKEKKYKAVLIISDGEDHDDKAIALAKQLAEEGIVINTIGVGTVEGGTIPDKVTNDIKRDMNGNVVVSKLNETTLKEIAEVTGGSFHRLDNAEAAAEAVENNIGKMEKKVISSGGGEKLYSSFYPFFLAIALLLIIAELFITEIKK